MCNYYFNHKLHVLFHAKLKQTSIVAPCFFFLSFKGLAEISEMQRVRASILQTHNPGFSALDLKSRPFNYKLNGLYLLEALQRPNLRCLNYFKKKKPQSTEDNVGLTSFPPLSHYLSQTGFHFPAVNRGNMQLNLL